MAIQKDNHIDPNLKARWGFGGTEGELTVGPQTVGETGGVEHARTRIEGGAAHNTGGGAEAVRQALDLEAVNLLAAGLEAGVLNPVEGDGPALRIHQALSGLQESMQRLAQERDEAREELVELKKVQPADPLAELTAAQLKEQLDAKGIAYKSGDLKPELLALLKAAQ
jgi:hypothetical protein